MIQPANQSDARLGFLTVVEHPEAGYSGGLLIVSAKGRPIEFHCTASVPVNRAQKILYGKTYQSFLFCDQIGISLIEKARTQPQVYLTDQVNLLPLADAMDPPILLLHEQDHATDTDNNETTSSSESDSPQPLLNGTPLVNFELPTRRLWFEPQVKKRVDPFQKVCECFARTLPLTEPLERIRQAISEAQTVAR